MSDSVKDASYRKQLRFKVALLTGLMTMRDDLDADIAEMMGQMSNAQPSPQLNRQPQPLLAEPTSTETPAAPNAKSAFLKLRWAAYRAGQGPKPTEKAKRGRPKSIGTTASGRKIYPKTTSATIGVGTNADFIYKYAAAHGDLLQVSEATAAAGKTAEHRNLSVRGRLTVALAEMKRKGFLDHEKERGVYRLTPLAHQIRRREEKELNEE